METRVALIGIVVNNNELVDRLNSLLHDYSEYIIGRMGIPYKKRDMYLISIAIDAPADTINSLSGKIGEIEGIKVKTLYQ